MKRKTTQQTEIADIKNRNAQILMQKDKKKKNIQNSRKYAAEKGKKKKGKKKKGKINYRKKPLKIRKKRRLYASVVTWLLAERTFLIKIFVIVFN